MAYEAPSDFAKIAQLEEEQNRIRDILFFNSVHGVSSAPPFGQGHKANDLGIEMGVKSQVPIERSVTDVDENDVATGTFDRLDLHGQSMVVNGTPATVPVKHIQRVREGRVFTLTPKAGKALQLQTGGNIDIASNVNIGVGQAALLQYYADTGKVKCIAAGGAGGGVSFPITPTINDHGNVGTVTEDIDLSAANGHVHKITLTGNPTLTFSNPPASGTQIEFEIEFVQDATGGRTVTFPASVVETVSIHTDPSKTTIVTFRTNDGGTNYHAIPSLRGSISLPGSFLPLAGGTMTGIIAMNGIEITLDADADTSISSPTDDAMTLKVGGDTRALITSTLFDLAVDLDLSGNEIKLDLDGDTTISSAVDDTLTFRTGAVTRLVLANTIATLETDLDINGNDIIFDVDGDSKFVFSVDDVITINLGGAAEYVLTTTSFDIEDKFMQLSEITKPSNPGVNAGRLYAKDDGGGITKAYFLNSAGTEYDLTGSTWILDVDADGFDLTDLSNIQFRETTGAPASTVSAHWHDAGGQNFNVPSGDGYDFLINGISELFLNSVALDLQGNNVIDLSNIEFRTTLSAPAAGTQAIYADAGGIIFNVPTADDYDFRINNVSVLSFDGTDVDFQAHNLTDCATITPQLTKTENLGSFSLVWNDLYIDTIRTSRTGQSIDGSTVGFIYNVDSPDQHSFRVDGSDKLVIQDDVIITLRAFRLASFSDASRPAAGTAGAGAIIWSTTDNVPIYSDGTNWRLFSDDSVT